MCLEPFPTLCSILSSPYFLMLMGLGLCAVLVLSWPLAHPSSSAFRRWLMSRTSLWIAQDVIYPKLSGGEYGTVVQPYYSWTFWLWKNHFAFLINHSSCSAVLLRCLEDSVGCGYALKSVECNMKARACNYSLCSLLLRDGPWVIIITWCSQSTGIFFFAPSLEGVILSNLGHLLLF